MIAMTTIDVRERPILFSGEMVRAILSGRKTQTRRLVKEPWRVRLPLTVRGDFPFQDTFAVPGVYVAEHNDYGAVSVRAGNGKLLGVKPDEFEWVCQYGQAGDRLWVRETWQKYRGTDVVQYRADLEQAMMVWRPSIFMPRWASRLTLEVLAVRAERLQAISSVDAIAETGAMVQGMPYEPREHFAYRWDAINGKRATWASNPWVWCISFRRVTP